VKAVRSIVIWVGVVLVTAGAGFGAGYFFRDKEAKELGQLSSQEKEEMAAKISSLEIQILEAQKSQLERALARAKLKAGLNEVLDSLVEALAEVEQRNFGRATQKIEAARATTAIISATISMVHPPRLWAPCPPPFSQDR